MYMDSVDSILYSELIFICIIRWMWGYICYEMATNRNRNPKIAFVIGFIFTLFGVIGYAIAGKKIINE